MLRTTISRIRKVCSIAFIPRILRGDQSSAVSYAVRKAHKSTKSTDDDEQASKNQRNDSLPQCMFSSEGDLKIHEHIKKKIAGTAGLHDRTAKDNKENLFTAGLPLTHRERCQRIIDQAFGKPDNMQPDRMLNHQYFSRTVNLEATRREIHESERAKLKLQEQKIPTDNTNTLLLDDRSQYSAFNMSRELNLIDDNHDEVIITHSPSAKEPDFTKNLENVKGTAEETLPVEEPILSQAKEDFDKSVNNPENTEKKALCVQDAETIEVVKDERKPDLYRKATLENQSDLPWFLKARTTRENNLTFAKEDVDTIVNNPESIEKKALCDDNTETIKVVEDERKPDLYRKTTLKNQSDLPWFLKARTTRENNLTFAKEDVDTSVNNPESIEKKALCDDNTETIKVVEDVRKPDLYQEATPNDQSYTPQVLNATTAKQKAELLTQKQETIEETPIVAAPNPKLEENVTPRVLASDPTLNCKVIKDTQATSNEQPYSTYTTTAEQEEELFIQKLETIEETPIVAAPNPKLEENVTPRVLANDPTLNCKVIKITQPTPNDQTYTPLVLNATTVKQEDGLLTQKLETIEETPIVEAQNPKLEGNVTPRDLGNEPTLKYKVIKNTQATSNEQPYTTHTTTAEQEEELFIQKLETIEETPIVEAQNPKLEGNVTPRDLGNEPTLKYKVIKNTQATPNDQTYTPQVLNAINAKQEDGLLTQQLETIEETPIVEAQKPKLEGNVTPRVLGNETTLNCAVIKTPQNDSPEMNLPGALDEVSKSCLECPLGRADEILIDQMEKLGMTYRTEQEAPSTSMKDDQVQMDEQEILYESPKLEEEGNERVTDTGKPNVNEQEIVNPAIDSPSYTKEYDPAEDYNSTTHFASNYIPPTYRTAQLDPDSENTSLPEELLKERTLNPCYVLTCNETCPISPGSTMSACQNSDFVDTTGTIYMKKNICESVRPKPIIQCEKMSQVQPNEMEFGPKTPPEMHATGVPEIKCVSVPDSIGMPKLDEQVPLSELLKRVRERSRLAYSQAKVGKCGGKAPYCNPVGPRSPPNNPVPKPTFGLPMLKRRPPVCPKRKPYNKCSRATNFPEIPYELNEAEDCAIRSNVNLNDEVIDRLQNLGKILVGVLRQAKPHIETLVVKDYEPWAPIPSWNIPKKTEKKEWQPGLTGVPPCVKGCPNFPKARVTLNPEPPCNLKPCEGFPKRRSFSMLDYFTVSLGENKVYDLGDF